MKTLVALSCGCAIIPECSWRVHRLFAPTRTKKDKDFMPSRPAHLVHTECCPVEDSTAYLRLDRSIGPRSRSSAGEHAVHTGGVVGSIPTATTTSTTIVGDISEALATAALLRLGYLVSRPLSNGLPYDLIIDDGTTLARVQVKTARLKDGALSARLGSSKYHRGRRESIGYRGRVEWVIMVWQDTGRCFIVRPEDADGSVMLRVDPSRNNQNRGVRWAADYELAVALGPARSLATPSIEEE